MESSESSTEKATEIQNHTYFQTEPQMATANKPKANNAGLPNSHAARLALPPAADSGGSSNLTRAPGAINGRLDPTLILSGL